MITLTLEYVIDSPVLNGWAVDVIESVEEVTLLLALKDNIFPSVKPDKLLVPPSIKNLRDSILFVEVSLGK